MLNKLKLWLGVYCKGQIVTLYNLCQSNDVWWRKETCSQVHTFNRQAWFDFSMTFLETCRRKETPSMEWFFARCGVGWFIYFPLVCSYNILDGACIFLFSHLNKLLTKILTTFSLLSLCHTFFSWKWRTLKELKRSVRIEWVYVS